MKNFQNLKLIKIFCGYSPERINPGDKIHKLDNIEKIISSANRLGLNLIQNIYKYVTKKINQMIQLKLPKGRKLLRIPREISILL